MKQHTSQEILVLAALLHDIGKFAQRARRPCTQNMDQNYLPDGKSHRHVLYTDHFIEKDLPLPPELESKRSVLARIASSHHRPDNACLEECCLQLADCLSSGLDRQAGDSDDSYLKARMESIFTHVRLAESNSDHTNSTNEILRYNLLPLTEYCMPVTDTQAKQTSYKFLFDQFLEEVEAIPTFMGVRHYTHSLMTLLEQYTWCIPSSTYRTKADTSLYDHATTTAALAQSLLCHANENGQKLDKNKQTIRHILFMGDISGIQKYIFCQGEGGNKGLAKILRARSFALQAVVRSLWLTLLERLQLTHVARIMDAGGRFALLLPHTKAVQAALQLFESDVQKYFFHTYNGILRVHFAHIDLCNEDLERENFRDAYDRCSDKLDMAKLAPFHTLLKAGQSPVLDTVYEKHQEALARDGLCAYCQMHPATLRHDANDEREGTPICQECESLMRIGAALPTASYMVFHRGKDGIQLFGALHLSLLEDEKEIKKYADALDIVTLKDRKAYSASPLAGYIPLIDEDDLTKWQATGRMPAMQEENSSAGQPKTFTMLGECARIDEGKDVRCVPLLGALKADVDDLGLILGIGLHNHFSLSRFAMLSRMMQHFFSYHVVKSIEQNYPNIYVIFAGGDDLFVLGPWWQVLEFAQGLHKDFALFCGQHPEVHLSAGIAVVKPRVPLRSIANNAEYLLLQAKEGGKNSVSVFERTVPWQSFAPQMELGAMLERLALKNALSQGFIRRLLVYADDCRAFWAGDVSKGLYASHMRYDFARNVKEDEMDPHDVCTLKTLMGDDTNISKDVDRKDFQQARMGISFALYRLRKDM